MKKHIKEFLKYLEKETTISFDFSVETPSLKMFNSVNQPIRIDVVEINDGKLGFTVISCDCKNCKNIIGIELLYGANGSIMRDAQAIKQEIKSVVQAIDVRITDVSEDISIE